MIKIIEQISELVSSKIGVLKIVTQIIKLETKLAALSVYPLIINACLLFAALISVWLCALGLGGYYLHGFFTLPATLAILLVVNVILMAIMSGFISRNLRNMSFRHTRDYFSPDKEETHEQQKTDLQTAEPAKHPAQTGKDKAAAV